MSQTDQMVSGHELDIAIEAEAAGEATPSQLALLESRPAEWRAGLHDLVRVTGEQLAAVRTLTGPERAQVVADFEQERARLARALRRLDGGRGGSFDPDTADDPGGPAAAAELDHDNDHATGAEAGQVRLQASWADGEVVVWAAGPQAGPADEDELSSRLERLGAPATGWRPCEAVPLPSSAPATANAIRIDDALGWLVALGAGPSPDGVGASLVWLGRVAAWAVRLVGGGAIVPTLTSPGRPGQAGRGAGRWAMRWAPALVDRPRLDRVAAAMPGPVAALDQAGPHAIARAVLGAAVHAIASDAARRLELPAPPPVVRTSADLAESLATRLDGSPFEAPARLASALVTPFERWAQPVLAPVDGRLVVQLEPPDGDGGWPLSILGPGHDGRAVPLEMALVDGRSRRRTADEASRLERLLPVMSRPGGLRRGETVLSAEEAWHLMTETGPVLAGAGFDVRVPALSRERPAPALRMRAEPLDESVVGAHQLAGVQWSAVVDDVELTADDVRRLAAEARPLVRSRGRWVELDKADLAETAAALAQRAGTTQLTGAEILRHAIGLESAHGRGVVVTGAGWAVDLLARAEAASTVPAAAPDGFSGTLRSYQNEALAWLGFLDSVQLGGCLALDMGLGKTPTVLAHLARARGAGPALVVAPTAVVGNWAAEAARFTPGLRVVVHHGAQRRSAETLFEGLSGVDVVVTTYGTAVRDVEALARHPWSCLVLDEAQVVKNPASDTARSLRRIPAPSRLALTGTPVENGLGDLWAILDFVNPGLVGDRPAFVTKLTGRGDGGHQRGEDAVRALNGILVFRRTKAEPEVAVELPDKIDELDHAAMTAEQIGLYQAVLDRLVAAGEDERRGGGVLAAITALKQICNHPAAYEDDGRPLDGRSGKLVRLEEIVEAVFAAGEKVLVFTHFAEWGKRLAHHLTERTGIPVGCYHGGLARGARDGLVTEFQERVGPAALVLSLKAGGTGLNLTAANHVVLYDRWWNPAVEDQARDRAWRLGQQHTVVSHRLVCPGTVDERVEQVVAGKRHVADLVLPKSSSLSDLDPGQLRVALGLRHDTLLSADDDVAPADDAAA